ncbi:hypothetical protein [Sulfitobacter sp. EhC04]|uniref:hypothetical protein n=1 Tax=Sulfitobacter sp. EhC04 TaxID=1849168 RepID=UPI0013724B99|nr:hypothetical protein [Sulfitobacter sp. EhC04]
MARSIEHKEKGNVFYQWLTGNLFNPGAVFALNLSKIAGAQPVSRAAVAARPDAFEIN